MNLNDDIKGKLAKTKANIEYLYNQLKSTLQEVNTEIQSEEVNTEIQNLQNLARISLQLIKEKSEYLKIKAKYDSQHKIGEHNHPFYNYEGGKKQKPTKSNKSQQKPLNKSQQKPLNKSQQKHKKSLVTRKMS